MLRVFSFLAFLVTSGLWCTKKINSSAGNKTAAPITDTSFNRAIKNYTNYCGGCHGEKLDAFVNRNWKHGSTRQDLFTAIKKGYADEGMPDFDITFTDEETYELADYILTGIKNHKR